MYPATKIALVMEKGCMDCTSDVLASPNKKYSSLGSFFNFPRKGRDLRNKAAPQLMFDIEMFTL